MQTQPPSSVVHDPFFWVAVFSGIAAMGSAIFTWTTWNTSRKALLLAELQDERHRPSLVPYLADGFCRYTDGTRLLAFSLSLSNRSDSDNALSLLELQVDYRTSTGALMAVKLPSAADIESKFGNDNLTVLVPPVQIGAHETIAGYAMFELSNTIVGQSQIQGYTVLFTDTHGIVTRLEKTFVRDITLVNDERTKKRV